MKKKTKYTKLIITANALVPKGAVMEQAIFKSNEKRIELTHCQKNLEAQEMHSIWYPLNKLDSQGCFVEDSEVLKEAARDFFAKGSKVVKMLHDGEFVDGARVQELWIVKEGDPIFTDKNLVGSLAGTIHFADKNLFQKMKSEGWETSIEGVSEDIEVEETEKNFFSNLEEKLVNLFKNVFCKSDNIEYIKNKDTDIDEEKKAGENMPSMEEFNALIARVEKLEAMLSQSEARANEAEMAAKEVGKNIELLKADSSDMKDLLMKELKKSSQIKDDGNKTTATEVWF